MLVCIACNSEIIEEPETKPFTTNASLYEQKLAEAAEKAENGLDEEAIALYKEAIQYEKPTPTPDTQDWDAAIALCERAIEGDPQDVISYAALADAYVAIKDKESALQILVV